MLGDDRELAFVAKQRQTLAAHEARYESILHHARAALARGKTADEWAQWTHGELAPRCTPGMTEYQRWWGSAKKLVRVHDAGLELYSYWELPDKHRARIDTLRLAMRVVYDTEHPERGNSFTYLSILTADERYEYLNLTRSVNLVESYREGWPMAPDPLNDPARAGTPPRSRSSARSRSPPPRAAAQPRGDLFYFRTNRIHAGPPNDTNITPTHRLADSPPLTPDVPVAPRKRT
jgi:hypothetical protein